MRLRSAAAVLSLALLAPPLMAQERAGDGAALREQAQAQAVERDRLRGDAATLRREIETLRRRLIALGATQAAEERGLSGKRSRLAELNAQEQALRAQMATVRTQQARLLGALQLYGRNRPPALLVSPRSAKDAVRAAILMRALAPELEQRAEAFNTQAQAVTAARRRAANASEALFVAESDVADRASEIERLITGKAELERSLLLDADQADAEARRLAARAGSLGALVDSVAAAAPGRPAATRTLALSEPVAGAMVRRFGAETPAGPARGVTFEAERGAVVRSPADATITFAGTLKGHGVVLILRAAGAYDIVLAGLDSAAPPPGGRVAAGEPVGRMAEDGDAPQLYLELRRNGAPVDPTRRLSATNAPRPEPESGGLRGRIAPPG